MDVFFNTDISADKGERSKALQSGTIRKQNAIS